MYCIQRFGPRDVDSVKTGAFICSRIRNNLFYGAKNLPMIAEPEDGLI
jgi:hypothetical protein